MDRAEGIRLPPGAFYGSKAKELDIAGVRLTESFYKPQSALPPHSHERAHFTAVLTGRYAETIGRMRAQRAPGVTLFLPPDTVHEERHHAPGRHFMIEIGPEMLARCRERSGDFRSAVDLPFERAARLTRRLHREFSLQQESCELVIEGLVLLLLMLVAERRPDAPRHPPAFVEQARQFIHDQLARSFTIEQLAMAVGVDRWQLTRAFQRHMHCSPGEYLRRARLEFARQELLRPDRSLAAVALAAGFSDQSHFSRTFKSSTGLTPRVYRQQVLQERAPADDIDQP